MKQAAKNLLLFFASGIVCFLLIEGLSSALLVLKNALSFPFLIMETYHTQYDPQLGWVNIPGYRNDHFYGSGRRMQINSQGFRNDKDFSVEVPPGKVRAVCSGDSFTLGFDMDNNKTWCQELVSMDPRLETINMGQGGYGIDQAYLWYARDGQKFQHQLLLFAFVLDDFGRMEMERLYGVYDKPVLQLKGDMLEVTHMPVPKTPKTVRILRTAQSYLPGFRFYQLGLLLLKKVSEKLNKESNHENPKEDFKPVFLKIVDELNKINEAKESTLVLIFLPRNEDLLATSSDPMRRWVGEEAGKRDIVYLDLIEDFRLMGREIARPYFSGHYSEKGNEVVAGLIYNRLKQDPKTSKLFA